jgi:hypothetical protein
VDAKRKSKEGEAKVKKKEFVNTTKDQATKEEEQELKKVEDLTREEQENKSMDDKYLEENKGTQGDREKPYEKTKLK